MFTVIVLLIVAGIVTVFALLKLGTEVALSIKDRLASPLFRATVGAFLLAFCVYAAVSFRIFAGESFGDAVAAFRSTPADHLGFAAFAAVGMLALLWLVTGLWRARRRACDPASACWSAVVVIGALGLIHWHWYLTPNWEGISGGIGNATLRGLYMAAIVAGLVRLWLALPIASKAAVKQPSNFSPATPRQGPPWPRPSPPRPAP